MKQPDITVVSVNGGLLHVQFNPGVKLADFPRLFAEIRQLAVGHQCRKILIDAQAFKKKVGIVQRLQLAVALVDNFLGCRVAGVIAAESFDPQRLTETMVRNRGGNVKMTTSLPEALAWLGGRAGQAEPTLAGDPRASRSREPAA